jgi:putative alpha-1,2-mannosidase
METLYFYHYVRKYDRICEIMDECVTNCFTASREGLPGNGDSGGLTACYLWDSLGLFPISGQEKVFVGKPRARKVKIKLGKWQYAYDYKRKRKHANEHYV